MRLFCILASCLLLLVGQSETVQAAAPGNSASAAAAWPGDFLSRLTPQQRLLTKSGHLFFMVGQELLCLEQNSLAVVWRQSLETLAYPMAVENGELIVAECEPDTDGGTRWARPTGILVLAETTGRVVSRQPFNRRLLGMNARGQILTSGRTEVSALAKTLDSQAWLYPGHTRWQWLDAILEEKFVLGAATRQPRWGMTFLNWFYSPETLWCVQADTGRQIWKKKVSQFPQLQAQNHGSLLLLTTPETAWLLDAVSGELQQTVELGADVVETTFVNDAELAALSSNWLGDKSVAFFRGPKWKRTRGFGLAVTSKLVNGLFVHESTLIVSTPRGLDAFRLQDGTGLWETFRGGDWTQSLPLGRRGDDLLLLTQSHDKALTVVLTNLRSGETREIYRQKPAVRAQ